MPLTPAQLAALKADIALDGALSALPNDPDAAFQIAALYNLPASPEYVVYRTAVPMREIMLNGFDWTRVDNLSVGKARIWEWMIDSDPDGRTIDPSKPNVRAGINAVWVGTAADLSVRAAVYAHCHRPATRAERIFASGVGVTPDQSGTGPGTVAFEGALSYQDVFTARSLP